MFFRAAAGEFITRKSYQSTSNSRYLIVVGRFQILQMWKTIWSPRPELETMREAFSWRSFMTTTFQVNSSMFFYQTSDPQAHPQNSFDFDNFKTSWSLIYLAMFGPDAPIWLRTWPYAWLGGLIWVIWKQKNKKMTSERAEVVVTRPCFGYTTFKHAWSTTMGTGTV